MPAIAQVQVKKPLIPPPVKAAVVVGVPAALLGGLIWGVKGAVVLGVAAPVALFAVVASAMKAFQ